MQVQHMTLFVAVFTLSVVVLAYAAEEPDQVFLYKLSRLRDLAARAAAEKEIPELFGSDEDDYKRGDKKKMGIHVHSGINFGKRRESEDEGRGKSSKRVRFHKGLTFGKRAQQIDSLSPWMEGPQDAYNPVPVGWELDEFN